MNETRVPAHPPLDLREPTGCAHRPGYRPYSWGKCLECLVPWPCEHAATTHVEDVVIPVTNEQETT